MDLLSHLKLRTKLALLLGLFALGLVTSMALDASTLHRRMLDERTDKLKATVDIVQSFAASLEKRVAAQQMTRDQELAELRGMLHAVRFDGGDGYLTLQGVDGFVFVHGGDPSREGKASMALAADGRKLGDLIGEVLRSADAGTISYATPRPGHTEAIPKLAYISRFAPMNAVFLSGAFTDDLTRAFRAQLVSLVWVGGMILLVTLVAAWLINHDIAGSLGGLKAAMATLAKGDTAARIVGAERRDEVGEMAQAVLVFKDHMLAGQRLAAEQEAERERAENDKRAALVEMADTIERQTAIALEQIGACTNAVTDTAAEMSLSANRTGTASSEAAGAAAQALANAQTVASAAEELAASIREIGGQVGQSTTVVGRAVQAGGETRATIVALSEKVGRIGVVAEMIGEIAAKTNLLALNATIEAARAGDAGKGFAVVASEVKQLATQTAKSTEEIGRHIAEVKAATTESVTQVTHIEETITEVNVIAGSIAASVEEQGAATAEIARNVTETAGAANEMTQRTQEVSSEAQRTGAHATAVLENINTLKAAVMELKGSVIRAVRTSTAEIDRRKIQRYRVDMRGRITVPGVGTHEVRVLDVSEGGAGIQGGPPLPPRATGTLALDGVQKTLAFTVRDSDERGVAHLAFDQAAGEALRTLLQRVAPRRAA